MEATLNSTDNNVFRKRIKSWKRDTSEMEYPFLQKVYKKRKRTEEKIVKVAIPILGKLCYTKCCLKRELNDKR